MPNRDTQRLEALDRSAQARDLARRAERAGFPDIAAQARQVAGANDDLDEYHAKQEGEG